MRGDETLHAQATPLLVACLCAQWCGACRDYANVFAKARQQFAQRAAFLWVDIEDEADRLGDLDIDNFPSLCIGRGDDLIFFGPVLPHFPTLVSIVERALLNQLPSVSDSNNALLRQLRELHPRQP